MGSYVDQKPHAVCFPLPYQSHIIGMLNLAKLLYLKGFRITFVNTEFNHQKMLKSRGPDSLNGLPDFQFETIPDGLPPCDINGTQEIMTLCFSIINTFAGSFRALLTKLNESAATPPVTCAVSDGCLSKELESAVEGLGIPTVLLWTMSAAFLMSNLHCQHLIDEGLIPVKDKNNFSNEYLETPIDSIPGMTDIRLKDLTSNFLVDEDPAQNFLIKQLKRVTKASAVIIHTFHALESDIIEAMKPSLLNIYTIGPLQLLLQELSNNELNSIGSNMLKVDEASLKWLDSQEPDSVIYVNFGSLMVLTSEQFIEFAWGLANSKHPFLWVIRPDQTAHFPPGFIEETADRGMISGWCAQEQVLCHSSTAGFLTHCGWNSTIDTICAGVPVISWPSFADQTMNCRYSCFHWGIGIEMENDVKRDQVEGLVRELMEREKGKNVKKRAISWKKSAEESVKSGGSSYEDLNRLAEMLVKKMCSP